MTKLHTHYDNLKVSRDAPAGVIKAAYRALAQENHPDKSSDPNATRNFQLIKDAYDVLSDPAARAKHDRWITASEKVPAPASKVTPKPEPIKSKTYDLAYVENLHSRYRQAFANERRAHAVKLDDLQSSRQWDRKFGILMGFMIAIPIFVIFATVDSAINKSHAQQYQEANMRRN